MEEKKTENCFLKFIDEDKTERELFLKFCFVSSVGIRFETKNNWITVPWQQILKFKERKDEVKE